MIRIDVNGKKISLETGCTVEQLLEQKGYAPRSSVWINNRQVLLKEYSERVLEDQDQVKLLRILGGG